MNRAAFGSWGAGLDPSRFAAALAAIGVAVIHPNHDPREDLFNPWKKGPLLWDPPVLGTEPWPDPEGLAASWMEAREAWLVAGADPALARMTVRLPPDDDPAWLVRQLSRPEIGRLSVHVAVHPIGAPVSWSWPLEIGLLDDAVSERLRHALAKEEQFWPARFGAPRAVSAAGGSCDLLLLTQPLRAVASHLFAGATRASCVIVLRPPGGNWHATGALVRALQAHVGASGFAYAPVPASATTEWFGGLLVQLAHNHPLDVALRLASERVDAAPPLLLADETLLDETRLSRVARRLEERIVSAAEPAQPRPAPLRGLRFDSESHGASDLAKAAEELRRSAKPPASPRFIQARILREDAYGREPIMGALAPGEDHAIVVRVGPEEEGWTSAAGEPFPHLPRGGLQRLSVVFSAPEVLAEPEVGEVLLPAAGASSECEFHVRPPPGCTRLAARIIVLHENRVLQTARLDVPVGIAVRERAVLRAEPEAAVRLRLDDLAGRRAFDAALVVNNDDSGAPGLTAVAGDRAGFLLPAQFEDAVRLVYDLLEDAVLEPDGYEGLEDESSVKLLTTLANHGRQLYDTFASAFGTETLLESDRLQLVAVRPGADFPLELVYERIAPDPGAELCPKALSRLREGRCDEHCPAIEDPSFVCPLGFWGLTKAIERRPYTGPIQNYDVEVLNEPTHDAAHLATPNGVLFAASGVVAAEDVRRLHDDLVSSMGGNARRASSWQDWRDRVADEHPPVLVLLPHTTPHPDFELPAMEICNDRPLSSTNVRADLVCPSKAHRPLVILLGCNTAATQIPIYDFPPKFQKEGAALVVGTVTKVLGRHAAPVAARLVAELVEEAGRTGAYLPEVVRDLRRALLAEGTPFGMALVAHGDGDWILGGD